MKFPVDKCWVCGLDLTTVKPAEVKCVGEAEVGTCPQCSAPYFMVEDSALPLDAPSSEPVVELEPSKPRGGRRRAPESEPVVEPESEPVVEPESEPVVEPESEPVPEPESEPAPSGEPGSEE
ncbi:hypothetical protein ES704_02042 [subsurface metagenome]|jgi:hypothetical protein